MEAGDHPFSVGGKYDIILGIPFHCLVPEVRYVAPRGPLLSRCSKGEHCVWVSFPSQRLGKWEHASFLLFLLLNQLRNEYILGSAQMEFLWVSEHSDFLCGMLVLFTLPLAEQLNST